MRIKLRVTPMHEDEIIRELRARDIEICEDAALVLLEETDADQLLCRDGDERIWISLGDILYFESLGHDVFLYVKDARYKVSKRLYQLERELPQERFLRISNSVILARDAIQRIRPALSCKFILTLKNGSRVDVTRTYYYKFKEYFGI